MCDPGVLDGHLCGEGFPLSRVDRRQTHIIREERGLREGPGSLFRGPMGLNQSFLIESPMIGCQFLNALITFFPPFLLPPNVSQHGVYSQMVG